MNTTLIVGCGYVGRRVAEVLLRRSLPLLATVRRESSAQELRAAGIETVALDLDSDVVFVPPPNAYRLLYLTPPPGSGSGDPRLRRLLDALVDHPPHRLVYASSSAVYGDCAGAVVDETHAVSRRTSVARRRLDAEGTVLSWAAAHAAAGVVLRIAGIYGLGRLPLRRLREKHPVVRPSEAGWSNRIHVDDLARICVAALEHSKPERVYNVADGCPTSSAEFLRSLAVAADLPAPPEVSLTRALAQASPAQARYLRESRRLNVSRMRRDLTPGWAPAAFAETFAVDLGFQTCNGDE